MPSNILKNGGFIDRLNADDYLSDEDYRSPELIGWLYQFYISERKDEVFAKKGKFEADEIPAATQIFTPNWIVKYMVQNTVGRIYLDNNPYSDIKEGSILAAQQYHHNQQTIRGKNVHNGRRLRGKNAAPPTNLKTFTN